MTPPPTSPPSAASESSSDQPALSPEMEAVLTAEAPLLTTNPTGKPLLEMTDDELREWHARLTAHLQSPQTLAAHVRGPAVARAPKEPAQPRVDISKYE